MLETCLQPERFSCCKFVLFSNTETSVSRSHCARERSSSVVAHPVRAEMLVIWVHPQRNKVRKLVHPCKADRDANCVHQERFKVWSWLQSTPKTLISARRSHRERSRLTRSGRHPARPERSTSRLHEEKLTNCNFLHRTKGPMSVRFSHPERLTVSNDSPEFPKAAMFR